MDGFYNFPLFRKNSGRQAGEILPTTENSSRMGPWLYSARMRPAVEIGRIHQERQNTLAHTRDLPHGRPAGKSAMACR